MGKYDDILYMKHPEPKSHPRMAPENRAAQFMPFAALGSEQADQASEASRITQRRIELDAYEKERLNRQLVNLLSFPDAIVEITYFLEDLYKEGGEYQTVSGQIKKIDMYSKTIVMSDGTWIPIMEIFKIESDALKDTMNFD